MKSAAAIPLYGTNFHFGVMNINTSFQIQHSRRRFSASPPRITRDTWRQMRRNGREISPRTPFSSCTVWQTLRHLINTGFPWHVPWRKRGFCSDTRCVPTLKSMYPLRRPLLVQSYADEGHELQNVLEHVYSSMQSFFEECLSLDIDERDKDKNTWRLVSHLILRHRVTAFGTVPVTADSPAATAHPTWPRLRKHPKKHNSRQSELVNSINNQAVYIIAELSELSV
jgi:hypothetical protein